MPINAGFVGIFLFAAAQIFAGKNSQKCNTMQHEMQLGRFCNLQLKIFNP